MCAGLPFGGGLIPAGAILGLIVPWYCVANIFGGAVIGLNGGIVLNGVAVPNRWSMLGAPDFSSCISAFFIYSTIVSPGCGIRF